MEKLTHILRLHSLREHGRNGHYSWLETSDTENGKDNWAQKLDSQNNGFITVFVLAKHVSLCAIFVCFRMLSIEVKHQKCLQLTFTFYSLSNMPLKQSVNISKNGWILTVLFKVTWEDTLSTLSSSRRAIFSLWTILVPKTRWWRLHSELSSRWKLFSQSVHILLLRDPVMARPFQVSGPLSSTACLEMTINQIHLGTLENGSWMLAMCCLFYSRIPTGLKATNVNSLCPLLQTHSQASACTWKEESQ